MICFPLDNTPCEAKDMGTYLATRTRGVFSSDGNLAVTPGESGLSVSVSPGLAWLKWSDFWGVAALQAQVLTLDLDTADGALKRIDAIVCRLDKVNNRAEIVVKKGAPSSAPIVVPPVRDANYDELYIATVLIGAGVISISASAITDQRLNEEYCGLMRDGVTGIPTASLHAQAQQILTELTDALNAQIVRQSAEFDAWFEDLKGKLGEDPATALQQQVDNLNAAAVGDSFKLKGTPVSIAYAGANRIASIKAYGENAQGGTTEAPVAITGVDSVFVGGRNFLPKATETKTMGGVTFTPNPDGSVSVSGTATSESYYTFAHHLERTLLGRTVCLSGSSQLVKVVINEETSSGTFVRNVLVDRGQGASGIVVKQKDSNAFYAVLQVRSGDTVNEVIYPMLNLGSTAMPYETYQGSVTPLPIPRPLRRVGDVKDKCITRVKSVYDKRIVIDQNSNINMSGEASIVGTSRRFNVPVEDIPITNDAVIEPVRCNILPARPSGGVSGTYALDAPGISLQNNQSVSQPNINIRVPGCKTLEEIKAWLTDNPLIVHYQSTSYNGTNGLDVCLAEYQTGFVELDGTESNLQFFSDYQTLAIKGITTAGDPSQANAYGVCISSHFALVPPGTSTTLDKVVYGQPQYNQIIIHDTSWNSLETAKAYLAAQKTAGTPVQIAYQLATPEVYATDPVDFDNAAGPLTVLTGGELEAAFKSADKVVESRIDFVEDTLNEQGQAIAEKAPISHSSDKSTYGLGSGSQFGHVKLSDATASGSNAVQGIAATPSAVNQVHAKANAAQSTANAAMPKAGGTFTGTVAAKTENIAGAYIRNISVQNSASQLQYTNFIIMVRK